ncbi:hypothetical protein Nepgr_010807 [Nepenthes gracilis]|uniref:Uncharacterized protein n=1 Tax=Nepenthes gracilis TaxID=150966 RepID=A0AAD3XLE2_NEPGR|nr:hypothetical protein Nepgr_010807 [Nepenthes gracilis]
MRSGKGSGFKHESTCERNSSRLEITGGKGGGSESKCDKGKSYSREQRGVDAEMTKSRSRSDVVEEDDKASPLNHEEIPGGKKMENGREHITTSRDAVET